MVHCNPSPVNSVNNFRYYAVFVDDCTHFMWFYPLKNKSDCFNCYLQFEKFITRQYATSISIFHTDGGGELSSTKLSTHLANQGILHLFNCPHTPQQCGIVERRN